LNTGKKVEREWVNEAAQQLNLFGIFEQQVLYCGWKRLSRLAFTMKSA